VDAIIEQAERTRPAILVVDSIQTMQTADLNSPAGAVGQVREATARLTRLAKTSGIAVFLVGHVTKEGNIAGQRPSNIWSTRCCTWRGSLPCVPVAAQREEPLWGHPRGGRLRHARRRSERGYQPSAMFLSERETQAAGSVVAVTLEGSRPCWSSYRRWSLPLTSDYLAEPLPVST
jgi:DNA repair protein RadA/Sms